MLDCIVVGYHESDSADIDPSAGLLDNLQELPAPIRGILRSQVVLDGRLRPYLDALSYLHHRPRRRSGDTVGSVYSVAEVPNLGTLYLVNYLRKQGRSADFVNSFTFERGKLEGLLARDPLAVAITTTFYMFPAPVMEIVRFIRERNTTAKIIVGGPLIDNYCRRLDKEGLQRAFDRIGADLYVWDAQGEATLGRVVAALNGRRPLGDIPNLFSKSDSSWALAARSPESNDLNECAVDWKSFDRFELGLTVSTRTARSCAFKCAFCDYPTRAGALAFADIATVEQELEALANLGVRRVAFIDDTFNVPVRRFKELCRMMVQRDFGIEWFSYFRCGEAQDESIYDLMRDAGCRGVLLGVESGDDKILKNMDKKATTADYRFGIEQLKKRGIFMHASTVVGFPGETPETVRNTIDFLNETGPDTFTVNHWYYLHSTPIHARAAADGLHGEGFNWSHATMNSHEAMDAADAMYASVKVPAWMPVNGLDFWGVPYLMGKGMTGGQIVRFLRMAQELTPLGRNRLGEGSLSTPPSSARTRDPAQAFEEFCESLPLAPGRYRKSWDEG
ncbi:MAG: PhpK family radical SAM P-methyltransferase [Isosphaeraceae bacterium]|nr:PhpK family radical SAM P-methyltransferase [Isosphaeraceae bacterium]